MDPVVWRISAPPLLRRVQRNPNFRQNDGAGRKQQRSGWQRPVNCSSPSCFWPPPALHICTLQVTQGCFPVQILASPPWTCYVCLGLVSPPSGCLSEPLLQNHQAWRPTSALPGTSTFTVSKLTGGERYRKQRSKASPTG